MRSAFLVAVTIVLIAAPFGAAEEKDCHTLVDLYEFDGPSHRNDVPTGLRTGPDFVAVSGYTEKDADGFDADAFLTVWRPGTAEMPTTSVWDGPAGGYDSFFDLHYAIEVPASPVFAAGYAANNVTNGDFSLVVFDEDANVVNEDFFDAGAGGDDCAFAVTKSGNAIFAVGYGQPNGQADVDWAVVKYDLDGHRLWNRAFAGTGGGHDVARKVAPDGQGGIVVGGVGGRDRPGTDRRAMGQEWKLTAMRFGRRPVGRPDADHRRGHARRADPGDRW
ncbi:MAG: hypothetical protein M5R36_09475 [Deltaproteobacteria bacterium]|nr:hypothetical protein [Deltaproteobacteria bacterium]